MSEAEESFVAQCKRLMSGRSNRFGLRLSGDVKSSKEIFRCGFANQSTAVVFEFQPHGCVGRVLLLPIEDGRVPSLLIKKYSDIGPEKYDVGFLIALLHPDVYLSRDSFQISANDAIDRDLKDLFEYGTDVLSGDWTILPQLRTFFEQWVKYAKSSQSPKSLRDFLTERS